MRKARYNTMYYKTSIHVNMDINNFLSHLLRLKSRHIRSQGYVLFGYSYNTVYKVWRAFVLSYVHITVIF